MKKIITYGTFDYFHFGHYNLLKRAKELGEYLIVGVSTDSLCAKKGKVPILKERERFDIITNLKFVDEVIFEYDLAQKVTDIKEKDVSTFVIGDDYKTIFPQMPEYQKLISYGCEVIFLPRTPGVSTSELKSKLMEQIVMDDKSID